MGEHKILMAYDGCYFNNGCGCVICGRSFESGGIEFGFELISNGKINANLAICPDCMEKGPEVWKEMFLERAKERREYAKVAEQKAIDEAVYYESLANDTFILPTEEQEKAIRKEFPGEWRLTECEETPEKKIFYVLSTRGERTGEVVQVQHIIRDEV